MLVVYAALNVRERDDHGVELNAEFTVEADEPY
jgi:hypothetical protein